MEEKYNPYYSPDKLSLELLSFDEPDMSYEYNTICFWRTKNDLIYYAQDSGCSCPIPFEDYEGYTELEVLSKLRKINSIQEGLDLFDKWNKFYEKPNLSAKSRQILKKFLSKYLK